jgi:hypothetical protein
MTCAKSRPAGVHELVAAVSTRGPNRCPGRPDVGACRLARAGVVGRLAALLAVVICLAGCGASTATLPVEVVQNYLNALAGGNYSGACALLDARTRASALRVVRAQVTCETVFARCLPHRVTSLKRDPTQLFYSNVGVTAAGSHANASVSGTAVARAIRHVTLVDERGGWKLTSYGHAVNSCRLMNPRRRHGGRSRRP